MDESEETGYMGYKNMERSLKIFNSIQTNCGGLW